MQPTPISHKVAACLLALAFSAACRDEKIVTYRVAKDAPVEKPAAPPSSVSAEPPRDTTHAGVNQGMPNATMASAPTGPVLTWTAPTHWQPTTGSSVRKGSYTISGPGGATADMAITVFPGDVGGEAANINRWRGQVGLPAVDDAGIGAAATRIEVGGLKMAVVDALSPGTGPATRLVGAIVPVGNSTWFFKLLGPDAVVAKEKPAFLEMLQSVKIVPPTP
jgi:hypothetical protein